MHTIDAITISFEIYSASSNATYQQSGQHGLVVQNFHISLTPVIFFISFQWSL